MLKKSKLKRKKSSPPLGDNLDLNAQKWKKVKVRGIVKAEEIATSLENLIGLEVLESYDPNLVAKGKRSYKQKRVSNEKKPPLQQQQQQQKKKRISSNAEEEEEDNDNHVPLVLLRNNNNKKKKSKKIKIDDKINGNHQIIGEDEESITSDQEDDEEGSSIVENNLKAWRDFGIPKEILQALAEKGFQTPTEIQSLVLPAAIMGKKDILGAAETGSGKTLAFGIPVLAGIMELKGKNTAFDGIRKPLKTPKIPLVLIKRPGESLNYVPEEKLLTNDYKVESLDNSQEEEEEEQEEEEDEDEDKRLYALVLTPTRELAVQVRDHLQTAAKYTGIQVAAIFGGLSLEKQERILNKRPEIVVATPGRFWELYQEDHKHLRRLEDLNFLIIDETDRMVEKGHFEELRSILKVLNANEIKKQMRQNFIFSATLTLVHDLPERTKYGKRKKMTAPTSESKLQNLIEELGISQPKIVDITKKQQTAEKLTECRLICQIQQKDYYLYYFINRHPGRTIVFCNSIDCVKRLSTLFGLLKCSPLPLHANMMQKQRLKNLERFRDDPNGLLIATDVAARGLDIPNVDHVIHYQVPRTSENYVHRSGRTARANKDGITVIFMEPGETRNYVKLCKTLNRTKDLPLFPIMEQYMSAVKERVNLARELDREELKLKRVQTEVGWMKKQAEEMDMIIDGYNDHEISDEEDENLYIIERKQNRNRLNDFRNQLCTLLAKPIFPLGFSFKYPSVNGQFGGTNLNLMETTTTNNTAIKAMQNALEDLKVTKKQLGKRKSRK